MDRSAGQLIAVLRQTEAMYGRLLAVVEQEKQAAIDADLQRLSTVAADKRSLVARIERLDQQRRPLIQALAEEMALPASSLRLADVAERIGPPYRQQLRALHADLRRRLEQVNAANEECRALIGHCLRMVQNTLGFFQHWTGATDVYGASGSIRGATLDRGRLLSGAI